MIIDYYSEEFGHERKWMVDNNSWDIGSRKIVFAVFVIISISIQNIFHI